MASSEFSYDPTRLPRVSAAKVSIPPRPSDLLRRPRLLDFLHENIHRKLILVCAAAGYGKSSLLIDFVHDTDYAVAWYRLDESDIDLATLVAGLVAAIRVPFPDFQFVLPEFVAQPDATPHELATALIREIEAALHDYFILTLDDFHVVQDSPSILRFFDVLLADLPEQAHLLIAGRTLPPLRIASLAARQQIAGLSEEHLRFTPAETRALIQLRNGVSVPEEESDKLAADTEGWITGILLTSHLMWQGLIASLMQARQSEVPLYEYLADEVLDQQPDLLKQFLLESSVLPEMNPAVCDQVLVRLDSAKRLEQAEASRLFVSVIGDEFRTYQYHHLFRDFLLSRLRDQDPGRLQILQMRAGEWYAGNGMPEAAVSFYVQAGQLDRAAQLAEAHAPAMFASGRHATLRRWGDQLEPVAYGAPQLYRFLGAAAIDAGRTDVAEHALEVATVGFAQRGDQGGSLDVDVQRSLLMYRRGQFENALALAEAAVRKAQELGRPGPAAEGLRYAGLSQFALGNLSGAEVLLQQAASLLKSTRNHYDLAWVLTDLAWVLYSRGQLAYAIQLQQEALAIWRERGYPGPLALALNNLGWGMHMLGHLQAALATYDEALGWAQRAGSNRWEAVILDGKAGAFLDMGNYVAAAELYRQAMTKAELVQDDGILSQLCRQMAKVSLLSHSHLEALEWLRRAEQFLRQDNPISLALIRAMHGVIFVDMGRVSEGREVVANACAQLERSGALADLARTCLYLAYAELRDNDAVAAGVALSQAFELADRVGYDQMLVSEVILVRDMLQAIAREDGLGSRAVALLERARAMQADETLSKARSVAPVTRPADENVFEVRALGQSRVCKAGEEISRQAWTSQRTRELFLFLVDRAPIARDKILQTFWPDKPLARAVANLYQTLYRLRRAIECEGVVLEDQVCRFAPALVFDYDVARFESQAQAALALARGDLQRLQLLASAAELYTGEYLSDLPVDWALARREALSAMHITVLREYADELMNLTRYAEARDVLTKALVVEPFQDELHKRMLTCLARLGRRHEVVDYYRRYRESLQAELGLDPPSDVRTLYSQLIS